MGFLKTAKCLGVLVVMCMSLQTHAFELKTEEEEKAWAEIETQLPSFPDKKDLIEFPVATGSGMKYFIDSKSLSVESDDVIRYVLVILSPEGAENVSYEGMRCATGERRYYASGRSDKTWSKARSSQWFRIQSGGKHQVTLFANYFCPAGGGAVTSVEEARYILRKGGIDIRLR